MVEMGITLEKAEVALSETGNVGIEVGLLLQAWKVFADIIHGVCVSYRLIRLQACSMQCWVLAGMASSLRGGKQTLRSPALLANLESCNRGY